MTTKVIWDCKSVLEGLKELGLFTLEKRQLCQRDLVPFTQYLWERSQEDRANCSSMWQEDKKQPGKIAKEWLQFNTETNIFPMRTVRQWELCRKVVQFPFLEVFKTQLDKTLSNLDCPQSWPWFVRGFNREILSSLSAWITLWSYILIILWLRTNYFNGLFETSFLPQCHIPSYNNCSFLLVQNSPEVWAWSWKKWTRKTVCFIRIF